jgi:hypothetical protein
VETFRYAESDKGKCLSCGFLTKYSEPGSPHAPLAPKHHEIEMHERKRGQCFRERLSRNDSFPTELACFVWAFPLMQDVRNAAAVSGLALDAAAASIISFDRKCPEWFAYVPGLSPADHFHRYEMQYLEADRRQYERDVERDRREFEEKLSARAEVVQLQLAERNEALQRERDQEQSKTASLTTRITLVGLAIAVAQVLTLTKDSLLWKAAAGLYHWLTGR